MMSSREPTARYLHSAVGVRDKLFVWGGRGGSPKVHASTLETFNVSTFAWEPQQQLNGSLPDGLRYAAVTSNGENLYSFAGNTSSGRINTLYEINSRTLLCRELLPKGSSNAPPKNEGGRSVYFQNKVVVFGGDSGQSACDDVHVFDLENRVWVVQPTTGEKPPPLFDHTFTKVDHHRAVVFGGSSGPGSRINDAYVLDMETWYQVMERRLPRACKRSRGRQSEVEDGEDTMEEGAQHSDSSARDSIKECPSESSVQRRGVEEVTQEKGNGGGDEGDSVTFEGASGEGVEGESDEAPEDISLAQGKEEVMKEKREVALQVRRIVAGRKEQRKRREEVFVAQKEAKKMRQLTRFPVEELGLVANLTAQESSAKVTQTTKLERKRKQQKKKKKKALTESQVGSFRVISLDSLSTRAVAASHDTAVDFLQQQLYGGRHKRIPILSDMARKNRSRPPKNFI